MSLTGNQRRRTRSAQHKVRAYRRSAMYFAESAGREQLVTIAHLRVLGILDLQPGRSASISTLRATSEFAHDAFEVPLTRHRKQIAPALLDVIKVHQAGFDERHAVVC